MTRSRGTGCVLAAAVAAALLVGCAGVPTTSRLNYVRGSSDRFDEPPVRVIAAPPAPGAAPVSVVGGWLTAAASALTDPSPQLARSFMTKEAAARWPSGAPVVEYDESTVAISVLAASKTSARVLLTARRLGSIAPDGTFTPAAGELRLTLPLAVRFGQWRISGVPPALLLSQDDVSLAYFPLAVYYLDPARTVVVPEPVYIRAPVEGLATALVRRLLAGPTAALAPAVSNAIPPGTQLVGSVPVTGGVAEVNLSAPFLQASGRSLAAAAAQVVYTLRQLPDVRDVRLLVEGNPEPVPRGGRAGSVRDFDPDALPGGGGLTIVQGGRLVQADGHRFPGPIGQLTNVQAGTSDTAGGAAIVRTVASGQQLAVASAHASQARLLGTAAAFTPPTLDGQGVVWSVRTVRGHQQVVTAGPGGALRVVPAGSLLRAGPVRRLVVARDGTRVAALVQRSGVTSLAVGEVQRSGIAAVHWLPLAGANALDVAWADPANLAVLSEQAGTPAVAQIAIDGSQSTSLGGPPPTGAMSVAAAPGQSLIVAAPGPEGTQIWRLEPISGWRPLATGSAPAYPG